MHPILFELPWSIGSFGHITVYTYGVLLAAAYLLGLRLAMTRAKSRGLDPNKALDLGIAIIVAALLGAKLLLVLVDFDKFRQNPAEIFSIVRAGGVFYGGLIAAVAVAFWYMPLGASCGNCRPAVSRPTKMSPPRRRASARKSSASSRITSSASTRFSRHQGSARRR